MVPCLNNCPNGMLARNFNTSLVCSVPFAHNEYNTDAAFSLFRGDPDVRRSTSTGTAAACPMAFLPSNEVA